MPIVPLRSLGLTALAGIALPCFGAPLDADTNGLPDVWEQFYNLPSGAAPDADPDNDGLTNAAEAAAGTHPLEAASRLQVTDSRSENADFVVRAASEPGKSYRLMRSNETLDAWTPAGEPQVATGTEITLRAPKGALETGFFRVTVDDADADADGVSDWEERQLPGFDPTVAQSAVPGQPDAVTLGARLGNGPATVEVTALTPDAFEKEGSPAVVRFTRSGSLRAVTVPFAVGGNLSAQRGSASGGDYVLRGPQGGTLAGSVPIPFGVTSVDVTVAPVPDSAVEVPETLSLAALPQSGYTLGAQSGAAVTIRDATRIPANERLLIAYLLPPTGVTSPASGVSTLRLGGDNAEAIINLTFTSLTSAQSSAHLTAGLTGPDVKGLPRGQVDGNVWRLAAAQYLTTDQAMLDALLSGQIAAGVLTGSYPAGEIRGIYLAGNGATAPPNPPPAEPIAPLTGEALRRDVSRFLTQATFGPTQADLDALVQSVETTFGGNRTAAYSAWIDAQFALPQTRLLDYVQAADAQEFALRGTDPINYTTATGEPGNANRRRAWWAVATQARDQLRQRVAFALSQIFVVSEMDTTLLDRHYGMANYYDLLGSHADGSYRALLSQVSRSPVMGKYLSSLKNQKQVLATDGRVLFSPDENYAREVMQLFSIGLVQLHPDGSVKLGANGGPTSTYTNADITELARVLTGWSFSKVHGSRTSGYPVTDNTNFNAGNGPRYFQANWLNPMKMFPAYHDTGAKTVLGVTIPANLTGEQDLEAALDILANHANTAPFISRLLIQRLVTSNPSSGYIHRVAEVFANDGTGQRGNFKAVIKAILLDAEARNPTRQLAVSSGKQKEPILRYVQTIRAFGGASRLPLADLTAYGYPTDQLANFPAGASRFRYGTTDTQLSQSPQRSPTVFNWFLPGYSPGGAIAAAGLAAPEMQVTTETQVIQAINYFRPFTDTDTGQSTSSLFGATDATLDDIRPNRTPFVTSFNTLIAGGSSVRDALTAVLDQADLLLAGGRLKERYAAAPTPNPRSLILDAAAATTDTATTTERVKALLYLLVTSPEFLHQP